jgi:hypothetical protein
MLERLRLILMTLGLLFGLIAVVMSGYATCCSMETVGIAQSLGTASALHSVATILIALIRFHRTSVAKRILWIVVTTASTSVVWVIVFTLIRLMGLPELVGQAAAYAASAVALVATAFTKLDEVVTADAMRGRQQQTAGQRQASLRAKRRSRLRR